MDLNPEFGTFLSSSDEWCMTNEDKNGIRKAGGFYDLNMEQLEKSFVKRYQYWLIMWRYNRLKLLLEQYLTVPHCTSLYLTVPHCASVELYLALITGGSLGAQSRLSEEEIFYNKQNSER